MYIGTTPACGDCAQRHLRPASRIALLFALIALLLLAAGPHGRLNYCATCHTEIPPGYTYCGACRPPSPPRE